MGPTKTSTGTPPNSNSNSTNHSPQPSPHTSISSLGGHLYDNEITVTQPIMVEIHSSHIPPISQDIYDIVDNIIQEVFFTPNTPAYMTQGAIPRIQQTNDESLQKVALQLANFTVLDARSLVKHFNSNIQPQFKNSVITTIKAILTASAPSPKILAAMTISLAKERLASNGVTDREVNFEQQDHDLGQDDSETQPLDDPKLLEASLLTVVMNLRIEQVITIHTMEALQAALDSIEIIEITPTANTTSSTPHTNNNTEDTQISNLIIAQNRASQSHEQNAFKKRLREFEDSTDDLTKTSQNLAKAIKNPASKPSNITTDLTSIIQGITQNVNNLNTYEQFQFLIPPGAIANSQDMANLPDWNKVVEGVIQVVAPIHPQHAHQGEICSMFDIQQLLLAAIENTIAEAQLNAKLQAQVIVYRSRALLSQNTHKGDTRNAAFAALAPKLQKVLKSISTLHGIQPKQTGNIHIPYSANKMLEDSESLVAIFAHSHTEIAPHLKESGVSLAINNQIDLLRVLSQLARCLPSSNDKSNMPPSVHPKREKAKKKKNNNAEKSRTPSKIAPSTIAAAKTALTNKEENKPNTTTHITFHDGYAGAYHMGSHRTIPNKKIRVSEEQCQYCQDHGHEKHTSAHPTSACCSRAMMENSVNPYSIEGQWPPSRLTKAIKHFVYYKDWKQDKFLPEYQNEAKAIIEEKRTNDLVLDTSTNEKGSRATAWQEVKQKKGKSHVAALTSDIDTPEKKQSENAFDIFADSDSSDSDSD